MFGRGVTLFRIFGFEIRIDLSFLLIAVLIGGSLASGYFPAVHEGLPASTYWILGFFAVVGIFASIVLHELGHSLVARRFGMEMRGITLHMFGGAAELEDEPTSPTAELLVAAAGPATSFALAGILKLLAMATAGLSSSQLPVELLLRYLASLNLVLGIFNLLPAFPLDGGRILRAALWLKGGDHDKATRLASHIGAGLGFGLAALGVMQILAGRLGDGLWTVLIGFFIRSAAIASGLDLAARRMLGDATVARFMTPDPVTVPVGLSLTDFVEEVVYRTRHDTYPVTDGADRPRGLVAVGALSSVPREAWPSTSVMEIAEPIEAGGTVAPDLSARQALDLMRKSGRSRLLVVDESGRLVGLLTLKDLLETLTLRMRIEGEEI
ncbi:site-2 protease family protein [Pinisolibacter sp.]|uniref:site-2 protease family protein n=1 Tax=Pinisolibacter sp. TaxID=2172024 RepID=UPI002FDE9954